ncbi:hypothetical protein VTN02DRAFT_3224 [Thermoascus thermophilus]
MPRKGRYAVRPFYLTILVFTVIVAASWLLGPFEDGPIARSSSLGRRQWDGVDALNRMPECHLVHKAKDQCVFVRNNCPDHEDGLFSYLQLYYCKLAGAKPVAFAILILWLSMLFSTIGIAASDFLCINLSTLASILGMSESLTGVTFLAFGNGSPDVFSTFAAMKSNSGSLAVGELIGAASFITSVVAGSMALVRPFRVARRSFVRDVGYFVIAIGFSMLVLADGKLHAWECAAMTALYLFYVAMVVTWHWFLGRQRRMRERDMAARTHFHIPENQELDIQPPAEDDDPGVAGETRSLLPGPSRDDFDALERSDLPAWKEDQEDDETRDRYLAEIRDNMHVSRLVPTRRRNTLNPIRPSLVGALEFQSVLSSLKKSRNIHHMPINLRSYSDDPSLPPQRQHDNRSTFSNPQTRTSAAHLSPGRESASTRTRAVSANDAAGLRLDTSILNRGHQRPINLTVTTPPREPHEGAGRETGPEPEFPLLDQSAMLTVSPTSSGYPSRSHSPVAEAQVPSPDHLAPPRLELRTPEYQKDAPVPRLSPGGVSPRGTVHLPHISVSSDHDLQSPATSPFPPLSDGTASISSRPPSVSQDVSPDLLHLHGDLIDGYDLEAKPLKWWPYQILPAPQLLVSTLFPTLFNWKAKNLWEKLLGIIAAPSVFLLTITLPVVEPSQGDSVSDPDPALLPPVYDGDHPPPRIQLPADSPRLRPQSRDSPVDRQEDATSQKASFRPRWDSEMPTAQPPSDRSTSQKEWNRWLVSVQLFTAPLFVTVIGWTNLDSELKARNLVLPVLCSILFSLVCLTGLMISMRRRNPSQPPKECRPLLALLGFVVAIAWIATIATEVVSLLKTLGVILNISDSLLGLTVFAVGNSLGDLVADITVARLGYPVMALSACFGGPMLNILLGIGVGGLYMTLQSRPSVTTMLVPYEVTISKTLIISGVTLLVTLVGLLIVVPLNRWRMDRKIGWGLVALWSVSTLGNVIVELAA